MASLTLLHCSLSLMASLFVFLFPPINMDFLKNWKTEDQFWLYKPDREDAWKAKYRRIPNEIRDCNSESVEPVARSRSRRGRWRIRSQWPALFRWFSATSRAPKPIGPCRRRTSPAGWYRAGEWWRTKEGRCRPRKEPPCRGRGGKAPEERNQALRWSDWVRRRRKAINAAEAVGRKAKTIGGGASDSA